MGARGFVSSMQYLVARLMRETLEPDLWIELELMARSPRRREVLASQWRPA